MYVSKLHNAGQSTVVDTHSSSIAAVVVEAVQKQ